MKRVLAALAMCALVLLGAQLAGAGDVIGKDGSGDANGKGLTKAERDAIDIVSVRVVGQEGLGVLVTVAFKGNFEKAFGRGHLKNAVAVMVLHPKAGAGEPAGILTEGAGKSERDLRRSRSELVATVRKGRELTFALVGDGFSNVANVEVKVITDDTSASARTTADTTPPATVSPKRWRKLLKAAGRDAAIATAQAADLLCDELQSLREAIDRKIAVVNSIQPVNATRLANFTSFRDAVDVLISKRCGQSQLGATFTWRTFSTNEVAGSGSFTGPPGSLTAIRIVVPDAASTDRRITNFLCPAQLPRPIVSGDTITCGGGTLQVGQPFTLNLQTFPVPAAGMGGQLFGELGGTFQGPFQITGP